MSLNLWIVIAEIVLLVAILLVVFFSWKNRKILGWSLFAAISIIMSVFVFLKLVSCPEGQNEGVLDPITLVKGYKCVKDIWFVSFITWYLIGIFLPIFGICVNAYVATFTEDLTKQPTNNRLKWLLFISSICTALFAFLHPAENAAAFKHAWNGLSISIDTYRNIDDELKNGIIKEANQKPEDIENIKQDFQKLKEAQNNITKARYDGETTIDQSVFKITWPSASRTNDGNGSK